MIARLVAGICMLTAIMLSAGHAAAQGKPYHDVTSFGAKCDGSTNDTLAFQSAIAQAKATGGTIEVPLTGHSCVIADVVVNNAVTVPGQLDLSGTNGVCIVGGIGAPGTPNGARTGPSLNFPSSPSSLIKFGSSNAFCMKDLNIIYNSSDFVGKVIDGYAGSTGTLAFFARFENVGIGSSSTGPNTAACLISLEGTFNTVIDNVFLSNADVAICGPGPNGRYSGNNTVRNSQFILIKSAMIRNATDRWTIGPNNDFQMGQDIGNPVVLDVNEDGISCYGINVVGNWVGDIGPNPVNLITFSGGGCSITVQDNYLSGNPNGSFGIHIDSGRLKAEGNTFDSLTAAFALGSGVVADIGMNEYIGNTIITQNPISTMGGAGRLIGLSGITFYGDGSGPALQANGGFGASANASTTGNFMVYGTLSKAGGGFKIEHPLEPDRKYLNHSFVESPDMKNIYEGTATLDKNGEAEVTLPSYFEALNRDFRYQLTCIGGHAPVFISEEIHANAFRIAGGSPGMRVSWMVTGIRHDAYANAHRIQVVEEKSAEAKSATEPANATQGNR
jgi:hypothetical protein